MQEHYHKWYAQYLSHDMEMLVFGHAGFPVVLFPAASGRYYEAKDMGLINSAAQLIDEGKIKIYCPDSIDSETWYNYSIEPGDRVKTHSAYEQSVLNDVIEFAKFESERKTVAVAGCDFGGYHAMNIAFRHPDTISYLFSMGGFFDIKRFIYGFYDDNCYYNNPPDYMSNLTDGWYLERIQNIEIILGIGEWDEHFGENKNLSDILSLKDINNWLDTWKWAGHDWQWWNQMFPKYLSRINEY